MNIFVDDSEVQKDYEIDSETEFEDEENLKEYIVKTNSKLGLNKNKIQLEYLKTGKSSYTQIDDDEVANFIKLASRGKVTTLNIIKIKEEENGDDVAQAESTEATSTAQSNEVPIQLMLKGNIV
jgi:hypothetical protein